MAKSVEISRDFVRQTPAVEDEPPGGALLHPIGAERVEALVAALRRFDVGRSRLQR
jgi:hypothetical protein